jgi:hypothetical protein
MAAVRSAGRGGTARAKRLVGRDQTCAALRAVLADARAGASRLVLLTGEAGIGKSAVLAWLAEQATPAFRVARAACWEGGGAPPYWLWTQVLRTLAVPADRLADAAWLLEGARPADPDGLVEAADARFRLQEAVARVLGEASREQPVLVVLDDLHWADEPSLAMLGFVARTLAGYPMLLVGAYRDTEEPVALLPSLTTRAQELPLLGLSLAETVAMVDAMPGQTPPEEVVARLWERGGGNPFFVAELTRLVQAQGSVQLPGHLPAGVRETVRRRLARLSTECVRLLDWAAVAGRDIDVRLLVEAGAAADEPAALELLAQAHRAGVVSWDDPPRFTHDLQRDAILAGLPAATAAATHRSIAHALRARSPVGDAARVAAHLLRAGPEARDDAVEFSLRAAREATARLGHDDACTHYQRALALVSTADSKRSELLLEYAAAQLRTGSSDAARDSYREAAALGSRTGNAVTLARAALGLQSLGQRSGAQNTQALELLTAADEALANTGDASLALRAHVLAAIARVLRHGSRTGEEVIEFARRAVQLAETDGDAHARATAHLALHDAIWVPGSGARRLAVVEDLLVAARASGDAALVAESHLLRAAALIELGEPAGREELRTYIALAGQLGTARGRWGSLTRQATEAQIAGRAEESARLAEQAHQLGRALGEPDADGCLFTLRYSLVALGVAEPDLPLGGDDPLWPIFPLLRAWAPAARGEVSAAREALGDFSVLDITEWTGLEALAVAAVVFAAAGSPQQRRWAYDRLLSYAGTHVIVGGCASYHAAVDYHLGTLAAALGDRRAAVEHFGAALALHDKLGAAGWSRLTRQALDALGGQVAGTNEFRLTDGHWALSFAGVRAELPDAKGLRDLRTIIAARGSPVHVLTLLDPGAAPALGGGADPVLDDRARAEYRARLTRIDRDLAEAEDLGHTERAGRLRDERATLARELAAATGLGGRRRRLGDQDERARKTVSARVRDALAKIETCHPALAAHLRAAVRMGTTCVYTPTERTEWRLS